MLPMFVIDTELRALKIHTSKTYRVIKMNSCIKRHKNKTEMSQGNQIQFSTSFKKSWVCFLGIKTLLCVKEEGLYNGPGYIVISAQIEKNTLPDP